MTLIPPGTDPRTWLAERLPAPDSVLPGDEIQPQRPAAVLIPIVDRAGGATVLLTVRSAGLKRHAGQISFPGGRVDPSDAGMTAAALRETHEETGITPDFVTPVGRLEAVESITGFLMFPIVGVVREGFTPRANPGEVDEIFEAPLAFLMDPANRREETMEIAGRTRSFWRIPFGRYDIWGATARILVNLSLRLA